MDDTPTPILNRTAGQSLGEGRATILAERREAARQAISDAQARLLRLQEELTRAAAEWRGQQSAWDERQRRAAEELAERAARLAEHELLHTREAADAAERQQEQAATLAERESALAARDEQLSHREADLIAQLAAAETLTAECEQRQAELSARAAEIQRQAEEWAAERQAAARQQDAATAETIAESQRRIAALQTELSSLTAEHQAEQAAWAKREQQLQQSHATAQASLEALQNQATAGSADIEQWQAEAQRLRAEVAAAQADRDLWKTQAESAVAEIAQAKAQAKALQDEIAQLQEQLQEQAAATPQVDATRVSDLEKRLQMAIDELRNERQRVAEIQKQLSEARQAAHSPAANAGGAMDWEAQKRKLLQSLEDDFDSGSADDHEQRLSIEETIRVTSHVVDAKEREIEELRRVLEQQSANFGSVAVGAAALADLVDNDELLQQERQKVAALQEEWQTKLRQAEVELSLERAKLGRERVELEERLRLIEQAESSRANAQQPPSAAGKKNASGSRWFQRLGLRDGEG